MPGHGVIALGLGFAVALSLLFSPAALARTSTSNATARNAVASTVQSENGLADLPQVPAKMSCATLARTTRIAGLSLVVSEFKDESGSTSPTPYCVLAGHIAKYIGFEILLPTRTWRQRYLQLGCGGTCGGINFGAWETAGYKPLEDGYFVVSRTDDGHNGNSDTWGENATQRVDYAYLSRHDLALVSKALAEKFYGVGTKDSYFDGCSGGGFEALDEVERYPKDFNGVLAGAPALIQTELNGLVHEWVNNTNISSAGFPIVTNTQATLVTDAVMDTCAAKTGIILDFRSCAEKFRISRLRCTTTVTTNCLTPSQITVFDEYWSGPETTSGQRLYPGGYSRGTENGAFPSSATDAQTEGGSQADWLQYVAFDRNIGTAAVDHEQFTAAFFAKLEKLAPYWDATDPDLQAFDRDGGKLLLWQGGEDPSIPTNSSLGYYQAVVKAMGGLKATLAFARYYIVPGAGHCGSSAPDVFAGLKSVVAWVESHRAPGALTADEYSENEPQLTNSTPGSSGPGGGGGAPGGGGPPSAGSTTTTTTSDLTLTVPPFGQTGTKVLRSMELYPYPEIASYSGHGSVDSASSYRPVVSKALEAPISWLGTYSNVMIWCNASGLDCKKRPA